MTIILHDTKPAFYLIQTTKLSKEGIIDDGGDAHWH